MSKELISINLPPCRRIPLKDSLCQRADSQGVSRAEIPVPLTDANSEQPTFNDIAEAAMSLNCRVEILEIRFVPREI